MTWKQKKYEPINIVINQEPESGYEPTEDELLEELAKIISDMYLKELYGEKERNNSLH